MYKTIFSMLNVGAFPGNPQCLCDSAEKKKFPVDAENIASSSFSSF